MQQLLCYRSPAPYGKRVTGNETRASQNAALAHAHEAAIANSGRVAAFAREAGDPHQSVTCVSAFPGDEIIHAAVQNACDLIALGAHGGRTIPPLLAGGVAQQVLAYSPVPVLMLRKAGQPDQGL